MADNLSPEDRRRTMQAVKGRATSIERRLWAMLAGMRVRGWRKNANDLPGKPDVALDALKIAIFVDGCFWHGCPICQRPLPETRSDYWRGKIERNVQRANAYNLQLQSQGWLVARFWEHEILRTPRVVRRRLKRLLTRRQIEMQQEQILSEAMQRLNDWLESCTRKGKLSRNTIAVGLVALHHLKTAENLPLRREAVLSKGGEIRQARGEGIKQILNDYGLGAGFLKEVTSRQAPQDGQRLFESLEWGGVFVGLPKQARDAIINQLATMLLQKAQEQLQREAVRLKIDQNQSPAAWLRQIVEATRDRSRGVVEQHIVGAKLETRFPEQDFPALPAHAADAQTGRAGDYELKLESSSVIIHVTAHPSSALIEKCRENLRNRQTPLILTLREKEQNAIALAEDQQLADQIAVIPIEHFVATNIIEIASQRRCALVDVLRAIIDVYNRRVEEAETDHSCKLVME